jgi:hypothetical protein
LQILDTVIRQSDSINFAAYFLAERDRRCPRRQTSLGFEHPVIVVAAAVIDRFLGLIFSISPRRTVRLAMQQDHITP